MDLIRIKYGITIINQERVEQNASFFFLYAELLHREKNRKKDSRHTKMQKCKRRKWSYVNQCNDLPESRTECRNAV